MVWVVVSFAFVAAVFAVVGWSLVRPLTHFDYRHSQQRLWNPLD